MFSTSLGRGVAICGTAALLAACIPVVGPGNKPASFPVGVQAAMDLRFKTPSLQLGSGETRSLVGLAELNGQALDPVSAAQFSWQVSTPGVLAVGPDGNAKALAVGTATVVLVSSQNPNVRAAMVVNVVANQGAIQLTITPASAVLVPGEKLKLQASVQLATGAVNANVLWSSSDNTVAAVNDTTGEVTALKLGRVTIRAVYAQDTNTSQVAELRIVADKSTAIPDAVPSTVIFGDGPPSPTPTASGGAATVAAPGHWVPVSTGVTEQVTGIKMIDAKTGIVMGEKGLLLKTTDGGQKWVADYPVSLAFQYVEKFDFGSADKGLAFAGGKLYRTEDGGVEWALVTNAGDRPSWFKYYGADTVLLISDAGLMRSDDGGASWAKAIADLPAGITPTFATLAGGETLVFAGNKLHKKLPDIGWVALQMPISPVQASAISDQVIYFMGGAYVGQLQAVWITTDGGKNVAQLTTGQYDGSDAAYGEGMDWLDAEHGFLVRGNPGNVNGVQSAILATRDGGQSWAGTPVDVDPNKPQNNAPQYIDMVSTEVGFAAGGRGSVFRYVPTKP